MKQYLILKEKNDSLNSLIGKSFNEKSKLEAEKILTEIHKGYFSSWSKALVYNIDQKTNEILGVGGSSLLYDYKTKRIRSDLILDNYGKFINAWFTFTSGVNVDISNTDVLGAGIGLRIYQVGATGSPYNNQYGLRIAIGSSSIISRSDFNLTAPFVTSPESLRTSILGTSIYTSGTGKITAINTGISPTGGAGTIAETGLFTILGRLAVGNQNTVMLTHDAISPTVSFIAGQQIVINYTWQL